MWDMALSFLDDINLYGDNSSPLAWNLPKGEASLPGIHRDAHVSISPVWGGTCVLKFFSFFPGFWGSNLGPCGGNMNILTQTMFL